MVNWPERLPQRPWRYVALDWLGLALGTSAIVAGLLLGVQFYFWAIHNPEVSLLLALYGLVPLALLYAMVRIIRYAWTGK